MAKRYSGPGLRPVDFKDLLECVAFAEVRVPSLVAAVVKARDAARLEAFEARLPGLRKRLLEMRDARVGAAPRVLRVECSRCGKVARLRASDIGAVHPPCAAADGRFVLVRDAGV